MLLHRPTALLAGLLLAPAGAQRTWIVDQNNGPGTAFVSLTAALASPLVRPGDELRVRPGAYASPGVIALGVAIVADDRAVGATILGPVGVRGIGATEACTLSGMRINGLDVSNCAGRVLIDRLPSPFAVGNAITVTGSPRVFVQRCQSVGSIVATDSTVFVSSLLFGNFAIGPVVQLIRSTGWFTDSSLGTLNPFFAVAPIHLQQGVLFWLGPDLQLGSGSTPVPAIVDGAGLAVVDPAMTWTPGVPLAAPGVAAVRIALPVTTVQDTVAGGVVTAFDVRLTTAPNTAAALLVGFPGPGFATSAGTVWFDPLAPLCVLALGATNAQGLLSVPLQLPAAPAFSGLEVVCQGIDAASGLRLTNPVLRRVGA
jgi:hypothetical protein